MKTIQGLYAIVDSQNTAGRDMVTLASLYARGGAAIIQLRDKTEAGTETFRKTAAAIAALRSTSPFLFIVNDDPETAVAVGADGVHVGSGDASIEDCRKALGKDRLIGYSSHSVEEAVEAERRGADYVAFGAIFPTPTKGPGHPVQGLEKLREVVGKVKTPVVAIGGIGRDNVRDVLATGVASVAMISALAKAADPESETKFFSLILK